MRLATENARATRCNISFDAFCDRKRARDALKNFSRRVLRPETRARRAAKFLSMRFATENARETRHKFPSMRFATGNAREAPRKNFPRRVLRRKMRARGAHIFLVCIFLCVHVFM